MMPAFLYVHIYIYTDTRRRGARHKALLFKSGFGPSPATCPLLGGRCGLINCKGPKDHINIRIWHAGSKAQYKGDTKNHSL